MHDGTVPCRRVVDHAQLHGLVRVERFDPRRTPVVVDEDADLAVVHPHGDGHFDGNFGMFELLEGFAELTGRPVTNASLLASIALYNRNREAIAELDRRGVKVTVSTDDPPFFHTTMVREYEELNRAFGWDEADFAALNRTALDAAFCDADTKDRIAKRLEAA